MGLYTFFDFTILENASFSFSLYIFLVFFHSLGRYIAIRELICFTTILQMLFVPTIVLINYPERMLLSSDDYLSYVLPAVIVFCISMQLPLLHSPSHYDLIQNAKIYLKTESRINWIMLIIGSIAYIFVGSVPIQFQATVSAFVNCLYGSVLYSYYSQHKYNYLAVIAAVSILTYSAVRVGAMGDMVFWFVLWCLIILITTAWGKKVLVKISLLMIAMFVLMILQALKAEYRANTWGEKIYERRADSELLVDLAKDRVQNADQFFDPEEAYVLYSRLNSGAFISHAMVYVPRYEPYANGEIFIFFISPLIPRFIWEDKPMTGGVANINRFTSFNQLNSSYNISPFGEAYVNFGRIGGVFFMILFGLLINVCFQYILLLCKKMPTLIFWLPPLFVGTVIIEADVLTAWGSIVYMSYFIFFLVNILKRFGISF